MPVFTAMTPESVHLGDKHIGALLAGDKLVYNRVEEWRKTTPGTLGMDVPEWASFMSILISGGGASGAYGTRSINNTGGGGGGHGQLRLLTVDLVANPGRRASVIVGAGGRALTSRGDYGNPGGFTRFSGWNAQSTWTAMGGDPGTPWNHYDGAADGWIRLSESEARYLDRAPGSRYYPQIAGRGHSLSPTSGEMGGGGGLLNNSLARRSSGAGGDGFAIIHFFGVDPTTPRLTGGGSVTPPPPKPAATETSTAPPEWAEGNIYMVGDQVSLNGSIYRATYAHRSSGGFRPGSGTYWSSAWEYVSSSGGSA